MHDSNISVRPARHDEGDDLTDLAIRSKSHWHYSDEFLDSARTELTIDSGMIASYPIYVLQDSGRVIGFYGLIGAPPEGRLEWMFLEPDSIGHGYGRLMWDHAIRTASSAGFESLLIESDRYAEAFYLAMGATRIGATTSPVDGAPLPLLKVELRP